MMPYEVKIGLYALTSAAGNKSGVCSRIQTAYGTENGQALMDYAMHALREAVNTAPLRAERTTDEMLFSAKPHRDSWYSDLFRELPEEQHLRFRTEWLDACREMGAKKVWLCVHGSGPDGDTADWDASASDDNALHSGNSPMASYIVAVSATDGRPVTWYRNEGGTVDSHALQETVAFMASYGLDVEGAIMDPCFCTPGVVQSLKAAHMDYVMGMPRGADGFRNMLGRHRDRIRMHTQYLVGRGGIFGISGEEQLWAAHEDRGVVNLYFSSSDESAQAIEMISKVWKIMDEAQAAIQQGKEPYLPSEMEKYFVIERDQNRQAVRILHDDETLDDDLQSKGFFGILSSKDFGAQKVLELYHLRDWAEIPCIMLDAQEGSDVTRAHETPEILSRFAVGFLTGILKHTMAMACEKADLDTHVMIEEVDQIRLILASKEAYQPERIYTTDQLALLKQFDVKPEDFDALAQDYNRRLLSDRESQTLHEQAPSEKRGRGRPKGSKNRKTLEKEAQDERAKADGTWTEPVKARPGRPLGSKDTKPRKKRSDAGKKRGKYRKR